MEEKKDIIQNLYNGLLDSGKYSAEELGGDLDSFRKSMSDANTRKNMYSWIKENDDFDIGDYEGYENDLSNYYKLPEKKEEPEEEDNKVGLFESIGANNPYPDFSRKSKTLPIDTDLPSGPLSEEDKDRMLLETSKLMNRSKALTEGYNERIGNIREYGVGLNSAQTKQAKPKFNPQTGKIEDSYLTPLGNRYADKFSADKESFDYRQYLSELDKQKGFVEGFIPGVKQGWNSLVEGAKFFAGEAANAITGSSKDDIQALKEIERLEDEDIPLDQGVLPLDDTQKSIYNSIINAQAYADDEKKASSREAIRLDNIHSYLRDVLEESGGDWNKVKQTLSERAADKSWGDKTMDEASSEMAKFKPTKGFGAWVGNLAPQMAPSAAAIALSFLTKNPKYAQFVGGAGMGGLTLATAGQSMKEARDAGATNGQVWGVGLADAVIEMATEYIPFNRYTSRLFGSTKDKVAKELSGAVSDAASPANTELQKLLKRANQKLGGKLFGKKNVKEYIGDIGAEGLSEFTAEALQTITPMIYQSPEEYPTLSEIFQNGWEGAKAGLFMGSVLGGASKSAEYYQNRARRKEQGFVDVAEVKFADDDIDVAEIVGKDKDGMLYAMRDGKVSAVSPEQVQQAYHYSFDEFENGRVDVEAGESYDDGYNMSSPSDMEDTYNMYALKREELAEQIGVSSEVLDDEIGDPVTFFKEQRELGAGMDELQTVIDYANAKYAYDGMQQRAIDDVESRVMESNTLIDHQTNRNDGMVHKVTLKDDHDVFVIDGDVKLTDDGSVNTQKSSEAILVMDSLTGKIKFATPRDIINVSEPTDAGQLKLTEEQLIRTEYQQNFENNISGRITQINAGDTYTLTDNDGNQFTATVIPASDMSVLNEDGSVNLAREGGDKVETFTTDELQKMLDNTSQQRVVAKDVEHKEQEKILEQNEVQGNEAPTSYEQEQELDLVIDGQDVHAVVSSEPNGDGQYLLNLDKAVRRKKNILLTSDEINAMLKPEPVTEQPSTSDAPVVTTQDELPRDEDGNLIYEQNDVATTLEDIHSRIKDASVAEKFIDNNIAAAQTELDAISGNEPQIGTDISAWEAEHGQWWADLEAATEKLNYWNEVKEAERKAKEAEERAAAEAEILNADPIKVGEDAYNSALDKYKYDVSKDLYEYDSVSQINKEAKAKAERDLSNAKTEVDKKKAELDIVKAEAAQKALEEVNKYVEIKKAEGIEKFRQRLGLKEGDRVVVTFHYGEQSHGVIKEFISDHLLTVKSDETGYEFVYDSTSGYATSIKAEEKQPVEENTDLPSNLSEDGYVADNLGNPIVLYHGTTADVASASQLEPGHKRTDGEKATFNGDGVFFATDPTVAQDYAGNDGTILKAKVKLENPHVIYGNLGLDEKQAVAFTEELKAKGHDGILVYSSLEMRKIGSLPMEVIVFDNKDIEPVSDGEELGINVANGIAAAEAAVNTEPTEGQIEAGNYKKGHVKVDGYDITIENPKGSERSGNLGKPDEWHVTMNNTYGYIRGTEGVDGDHIDIFLSDDPTTGNVYVVDQVKEDGKTFDEHKVMYGFGSVDEAKEAYLANYSPGWKGLGNITEVSKDEFKKWIESSHRKTKPFAEYKMVAKSIAEAMDFVESLEGQTIKSSERYIKIESVDKENAKATVDFSGERNTWPIKAVASLIKDIQKEKEGEDGSVRFVPATGEWLNIPSSIKMFNSEPDRFGVIHSVISPEMEARYDSRHGISELVYTISDPDRETNDKLIEALEKDGFDIERIERRGEGDIVSFSDYNEMIAFDERIKKIQSSLHPATSGNKQEEVDPLSGFTDDNFQNLLAKGTEDELKAYKEELEASLKGGSDFFKATEKAYSEARKYEEGKIPQEIADKASGYQKKVHDVYERIHAIDDSLERIQNENELRAEEEDKEKKAEYKKTAFNGYLNDKTVLVASRIDKTLSKKKNYSGKVMTQGQFIEDSMKNGASLVEEDYNGKKEYHLYQKGATNEYFIITKTEYDYGKFLESQNEKNTATWTSGDGTSFEIHQKHEGPENAVFVDKPETWVGRTFFTNGLHLKCTSVDDGFAQFDDLDTMMGMGFEVSTVQKYLRNGEWAPLQSEQGKEPEGIAAKSPYQSAMEEFRNELAEKWDGVPNMQSIASKRTWLEKGIKDLQERQSVETDPKKLSDIQEEIDMQSERLRALLDFRRECLSKSEGTHEDFKVVANSLKDSATYTLSDGTTAYIKKVDGTNKSAVVVITDNDGRSEEKEMSLHEAAQLISSGSLVKQKSEPLTSDSEKVKDDPYHTAEERAHYEELKKRMRARLNQLNAGMDPEIMMIGVEMTIYHLKGGMRRFADFCKRMIEDCGDKIRPHLKMLYNATKGTEECIDNGWYKDMDNEETVRNFDVYNFDKTPSVDTDSEVGQNEDDDYINSLHSSDRVVLKDGRKATLIMVMYSGEHTGDTTSSKRKVDKIFASIDGKMTTLSPSDIDVNASMVANGKKVDKSLELSERKAKFVEEVRQRIEDKEPKFGIMKLRSIAKDLGLDLNDIQLQELAELSVIMNVRERLGKYEKLGWSNADKFKGVVDVYQSQPTISMRSGNRVANQQYSTPVPISFVADMFVNVGNPKSVLEPSAGNGMMVVGIDPKIVTVNEIDGNRLENLHKQGFKEVTNQDGTQPFTKKFARVVTNPPFGSRPAVEYDRYKISGLDEQMVVNSLLSMEDDGRAAIIIGGNTKYNKHGVIEGSERFFFNYLYSHYNVADVINIDGELYSKQGTKYPIRMILIDGRKTADDTLAPVKSKANADTVYTFNDLFNRVNELINNESNNEEVLSGSESSVSVNDSREVSDVQPVHNDGHSERSGEHKPSVGGQSVSGSVRQTVGSKSVDKTDNGQVRNEGRGEHQPSGRRDDGNLRNPDVPAGSTRAANDGSAGRTSAVDAGGRRTDTQSVSQPAQRLDREHVKVDVTKEKTGYPKRSQSKEIGSVVPTNTAIAIDNVLSKFDDIDSYVMDKLGYNSKEELFGALSAEQVDSVALAIKQMENGMGFIIGDMTGVGKGRQAAALIRYAVNQGLKPIFLTEKANLFSDIYRDLRDIGSPELKPFIFNDKNGNNDPNITDEKGNIVYKVQTPAEKKSVFADGILPEDCSFAVLTYSQLNTNDKKKDNPKKTLFKTLAEGNILIMDESHNAGGNGNTGQFLQDVVPTTKGVTFLSGTFAKRADNMPIYALKTNMSEANMTKEELIEAILGGGVPLQEIMSKNLVESGQMIRRERDYTGVNIDWLPMEGNEERQVKAFNNTIELFNDIIHFQRDYITPIIDGINEELAEMQEEMSHKRGTKDLGISNTPFASKTFNLVRQLLFSLKAEYVADRAIMHMKAGRKPVIAVANTMEGFMDDVMPMDEDVAAPDFSIVFERGLESIFKTSKKDAHGNEESGEIKLSELPEEGQKRYYELKDKISKASVGLSVSPIDVIKDRIQRAGFTIGELTGRKSEMKFNDDGTARKVKRTDTNKKKQMRDFNNGDLDMLILNQSASTGISLHSSTKFNDQRQRVMIFAQNQLDVNTEIQMRGRTDRTGQVFRSMYEYIVSSIPAELRLMMMFKSKLKSLDANTTSSQKSKVNEMAIVDFLNKYGDQVAVEYLKENREIAEKLLDPLHFADVKDESEIDKITAQEGDASKIAGRVALLSVKEQEAFYDDISERYNALINYLNDTGTNDLEITVMPLRAETKKKEILIPGADPNGENAFAQNTYLETMEVDVLKKPMTSDEIKNAIEGFTGGKTAFDYKNECLEKVDSYVKREIDKINDWYQKTAAERMQKAREKAEKRLAKRDKITAEEKEALILQAETNEKIIVDRSFIRKKNALNYKAELLNNVFRSVPVGKTIMIPTAFDKNEVAYGYGMLLGFKISDKMTPSTTTAVFATLDGRRKVEIPFSRTETLHGIIQQSNLNFEDIRDITLDNWDEQIPTERRKTAYIVTGNILQAMSTSSGQLITFSTTDGEMRQGILMPDSFKKSDAVNRVSIKEMYKDLLDGNPVEDVSKAVRIEKRPYSNDEFDIAVPLSKAKGGKYFLNNDITTLTKEGDFYQHSGQMTATLTLKNLKKMLDVLDKMGVRVERKVFDKNSENNEEVRFRKGSSAMTEDQIDAISFVTGKSREQVVEEYGHKDDDYVEEDVRFRLREGAAPKKTGIGYKVFLLKDGKLYPPMVANPNAEDTPVGVWLDADAAPIVAQSKTGRDKVKAGGKGTQGGSGTLAYRPGWHLGEIPYALQFNRGEKVDNPLGIKGKNGNVIKIGRYFPKNFVWAEVEYADDVDYQEEAMSYGFNSAGNFQHSLAGLPHLPTDGSYQYRTNANPATDPWVITGAMKVNRILTPSEVDEIVKASGRQPQEREKGAVTDEDVLNLRKDKETEVFRNGNVSRIVSVHQNNEGYYADDMPGTYRSVDALLDAYRERHQEELVTMGEDGYSFEVSDYVPSSRKTAAGRRKAESFAKRETERAKARVQETADKMGVKVRIVENINELEGDFRQAKGWYSIKNKEVVVVIPNNASANDCVMTFLHEAVGHFGLRQLFGKHFDTFLDNVYRNADVTIQERIDKFKRDNKCSLHEATEEYLAGLAEDTTFNDPLNSTWWGKVKRFFMDMLAKVGIDLGDRLTDNELRYVLWRSYDNLANPYHQTNPFALAEDIVKQSDLKVGKYAEDEEISLGAAERVNDTAARYAEEQDIIKRAKADGTYMKAPNGKPTNLNERQWVQVRTKAFKKWFGDWEKVIRIEKLRKSKPIIASGKEYVGKYELNKMSAFDWIQSNLRKEYTIDDTGETILLEGRGVKKLLSHGMTNEVHLKSMALIPEFIKQAIFIEERPNEKGNDKFDSYRYYVCGLNMGGVDYTVKMVVGLKQGKKYYDHALTEIEKGKLLDVISQSGFTTMENASLPSYAVPKDTKLVSILQVNSSKVVDDNGEPKVVYHGTSGNFNIFDYSHYAEIHQDGVYGKGFYFTEHLEDAEGYGEKVINAFINVRNPYNGQTEYASFLNRGKSLKEIKDEFADVIKENDYTDKDLSEMFGNIDSSDGVIVRDANGNMVEIVAFNPNQIKSATENNGDFDPNKPDIRYRFIGEKGAANLDRAEEATTRMDNLNVARNMEGAGKTASSIKLATGWERGADGKWRYEVLDGNLSENWRDAETLGEALDSPELFKAYPQIKDINVILSDEMDYNEGSFFTERNTISAGATSEEELFNTLAHEIQHAIQGIEGFASGGNSESVRRLLNEKLEDKSDKEYAEALYDEDMRIYDAKTKLEYSRKWFKTPKSFMKSSQQFLYSQDKIAHGQELAREYYWEVINDFQNGYYDEYMDDKTKRLFSINLENYDEGDSAKEGWHVELALDVLDKAANNVKKRIKEGVDKKALADFDRLTKLAKEKTDYELYQSLAGEVEARNVQSRLGMTPEQRRESLAENTEDVARKDQIFLKEALGAAPEARYSIFEGGYKGKSMSKRATYARAEGKYPKTDFKKNYGVSTNALDKLAELGYIDDSEWHHTSASFRKTPFYEWSEDYFIDNYQSNKKEIDKLSNDLVAAEKKYANGLPSYLRRQSIEAMIESGVSEADAVAEVDKRISEREEATHEIESSKKRISEIMDKEPVASSTDTRFRKSNIKPTGPAAQSYNHAVRVPNKSGSVKKTENLGYRIQEAYQDSMISLKKLQEAIAHETGDIEDFENAYIAENRMSSTNKAESEVYMRDFIKPLFDAVSHVVNDGNTTLEDLNDYLIAKHGLERNEHFRRKLAQEAADSINEDAMRKELEKDGYDEYEQDEAIERARKERYDETYEALEGADYSGLTELTKEDGEDKNDEFTERAEALVDEFESSHETEDLWEKINAATKESLKKSYKSGLLTKENYEYIKGMYEHYVPLRGWDNNEAGKEYDYMGGLRMSLSPAVMTAKGRHSKADNVLAYIAFVGESAIIQGNRNQMKLAFLNMAENHQTDLLRSSKQWYVKDNATGDWEERFAEIPEGASTEDANMIIEAFENEMQKLKKEGLARQKKERLSTGMHIKAREASEHVVKVMRNGVQYNVYVNGNPRAAQAVNGMLNPDNVGNTDVHKALNGLKHFMAANFTSRNPAFVVSNLARDVIWAGNAVRIKEDKQYSQQYHQNVHSILAGWKTRGLLKKFTDGTLDENVPLERYFKEFMMNGGETGFTNINTIENYKRDIRRYVKEAKDGKALPKKAWRGFWDGVEFMNRSVEDISRFAVYMTSRQEGRTVERSIWDAKEITVNFNKKGSGELGARYMNYFYVFFNATIQSISNFTKLSTNHTEKMAKTLGKFSAMGMMVPAYSIFASMLMSSLFDDDDEEKDNAYFDLPKWVRENNLVIYVPFTDHTFITIPLPHELRPFYALGENALCALMGKENVDDAFNNTLLSFSSMLPLDLTGHDNNLLLNLTPTALLPLAENMANVDFFGKPIYKDSPFNQLDPEWRRTYKGNSSLLIDGTRLLNELGGGDNVKKSGWLYDWNPAKIEHFLEGYFGGIGKTINKTMNTVSMAWDEDSRMMRNIPVASSFVHNSDPRYSGSSVNNAYYSHKEEFRDMQHSIRGYEKEMENAYLQKDEKEYKKYEKLLNDFYEKNAERYSLMDEYIGNIDALRESKEYLSPERHEEIDTNISALQREFDERLKAL